MVALTPVCYSICLGCSFHHSISLGVVTSMLCRPTSPRSVFPVLGSFVFLRKPLRQIDFKDSLAAAVVLLADEVPRTSC